MIYTKKRGVFTLLGILICAVCVMLAFVVTSNATTAYAATTPKYSAQFDYERKTSNGTSTSTTTGTGYSVSVQTAQYTSVNVSVAIYGSSSSGTGTLPIGGYINSSTVNIEIVSSANMGTINVKNSAGTSVGTKNGKALTLTGLADGKYTVALYLGGGAWATSLRSGQSVNVNATTSFIVDTTAPTISGASTSTTGKYSNSYFTVSATDSGELDRLYYKKSGGSSWLESGTKFTANGGTSNGLYCFYATDKAGNSSSTYYVYYDNVKPTGAIKNSSGTTLTSGYTNGVFYYTAIDTGGISYLQYKTPTNSSWTTYASGTTIASTATNGSYTFRAVDKSGNISEEKSIVFDTAKPTVTLYGGTASIASGGSTNASYIKFIAGDTVSGVRSLYIKTPKASAYASYQSGSQYTEEGTYYFYCTDYAGNTSITYNVTLDKTPPVLTCEQTDFNTTFRNAFTVTTNEANAKMYYKTPAMSSYNLVQNNSCTISDTYGNGRYYFYAVDNVGNQSNIVWIDLLVIYPEAQIVNSSTDNSVCVTWDGTTSTATLNGKTYTKGTWVNAEGAYTFIITNTYGRSKTYTFSIGHYYVKTSTVPATCTTQGYAVYKCSHCSTTYNSDYTESTGHNYTGKTTASTCTEQGYTVYKCSKCSNTYTTNVKAALGHNYVETVVPATCTENGCTKYACSRCDEEYETDIVKALGHNFTEIAVQVTCTEQGCIKHTCTLCGYDYKTDVVEPIGHSYVTEVVLAATCTKNGERRHVCEKCGDEYTNVIPATGHAYTITDAKTENGVTHRHYTCTICGDSYDQDLGDQYEHVSNYVGHLFKQYQPYMWWVLLATSGVWSVAMGVAFIIAKKNEDREKAKKMLINYAIGLVVIAAILVGCPYLVKGIALLVT